MRRQAALPAIERSDPPFKQYEEAPDDYFAGNDTKAIGRAITLSFLTQFKRKPRNKSDNKFDKIYNESNDTLAVQKMLVLDMINLYKFKPENQKYGEHFDKIFYEYEKDLKTPWLQKVYDLVNTIKKNGKKTQ